jgi:hypothetical protein
MSLLVAGLVLVGALLIGATDPGKGGRLRRLSAALERSGQDSLLLPGNEPPTLRPGDALATHHNFV